MARTDGLRAIQAGLGPAMLYQLVMNGLRLGTFAEMEKRGLCRDHQDQPSASRTAACSVVAGVIGGLVGSPVFLVKTHLQTSSSAGIAVGHQHQHGSMIKAFTSLYKAGGVPGLWQGASASVPRISIGSAAQLLTYTRVTEMLGPGRPAWQNNFLAALLSGFVVAVVINPLDVIATR